MATTNSELGDIIFASVADAYIQVSTFVAGTFFLFYGVERWLKIDATKALRDAGNWQVPVAAGLGALPGCGGAIIVVTQYVTGRLSFGGVVAALTATMGDAAFLLIAQEPLTGLAMVVLGFTVGTLSGWIINAIHGGLPEQEEGYTGLPSACVPDRCVITIDRRFLAEEELAEVKGEITALLDRLAAHRPDFSYEVRDLFEVHPVMADRDAPVVTTVSAAIREVMGIDPDYVVSPGTYDQKHIDRIGRLRNCIAYGPGILELAHQPDEWIGITDMKESAAVMALSLAELQAPDYSMKAEKGG